MNNINNKNQNRYNMNKSQILTTLWLVGFPFTIIFFVSNFVFSNNKDLSDFLSKKDGIIIHSVEVKKPDCSPEKVNEILAPATASDSEVYIDCNLNLKATDVVTKRMIFEGEAASFVTLNCNGALINGGIEVKSKTYMDGNIRKWERPKNTTIRKCNITGSVRIWGMGRNGEGDGYDDNYLRESSKKKDTHVATARNNAPTNIILEDLIITNTGGTIPLYFAPGVTYSKLINSTLYGKSVVPVIYLDAESYANTIKHNNIYGGSSGKILRSDPVMAIDGSSYNLIINNYFHNIKQGGIYLYRNCGKNGVIRHSTPSHNQIINNIFHHIYMPGGYGGVGRFPSYSYQPDPYVYLASRDGRWERVGIGPIGFCSADDGYDFGSSKSDLDYARYNVVMQNRFYRRSVNDVNDAYPMVRTGDRSNVNFPNYIDYNETLSAGLLIRQRRAGCYVTPNGYEKDFILDGETIEVLEAGDGAPASYNYTCNDGELTRGKQNSAVTRHVFDCRADSDNNGCSTTISCPSGQKIIGATAACNLEYGEITDDILGTVPTNHIEVITPSDNVSEGTGFIGTNKLQKGRKIITGVDGLEQVSIGCKEHDANGGDCHIKAILYCR